MQYIVEPGMGVSYGIGRYNMDFRFFEGYLQSGMTVYDIGANRGQCTLFFAKCVGAEGTVLAFEPAPQVFDSLQRNVALNDLENVETVRAAVAEHEGSATFSFDEQQSTRGKLEAVEPTYQNKSPTSFEVQTTTLDSLMAQSYTAPDLLKIDVEGGAGAALRGARKLLREVSPSIYIELHGPEEQKAVRDELLSIGYTLKDMQGETVDDPVSRWRSPLWCRKK